MPDKGLICLLAGIGGTMGDVRPLIALALALRARGFEILLLGDITFERLALRAGIRESEWFSSSEVPQTFWFRTAAGQRGVWGARRTSRDRWLLRELRSHWRERTEAFWRMAGGSNNPRIVAAVGGVPAYREIRRFGPQCAKVISSVIPFQPSKEFTLAPPDRSPLQRLRDRWHGGAVTAESRRALCEETFHLVSVSPAVFPRPSDWPPNMQVTGITAFEDDRLGWSPPTALREFLAKGPPPVYVGFGQHAILVGPRGVRRTREIIEGCRRAGVRCIIHCPDLPSSFGSESVFVVNEQISHAWLFPQCAAVVHHGGYGTIHASLTARRPMVIYPFQVDQFFWAKRIGELNVGPGFTARLRDLSAPRLAADLDYALRPECEPNAARLGAAVMRDDGLATQVAAIESIVDHTRRGLRPSEWHMPEAVPSVVTIA